MTAPADAGRMAAVEAIGDMLAVLGTPPDRMLSVLVAVEEAAPGRPTVRDVARKARGVAARLTAAAEGAS